MLIHCQRPEVLQAVYYGGAFLAVAAALQGFSGYVHSASRVLEEGGIRHLLIRVFQMLCSSVVEFGSISFFARDLDGKLPRPKASLELDLRQASPQELNLLEEIDPKKSTEGLPERFQSGDLCFVAIDADGQIAHSRWVTVRRAYIPELDRYLVLSPGQGYFYDGYTRPDRRRRGIDGVVREFIFTSMRTAGCRRIYSYVRGDNPIGLKATRSWQEAVGKLWYLRLRGFRPLVVGIRNPNLPTLVRRVAAERAEKERLSRVRVWRGWFEGWLKEPLDKRSTGYHSLPQEYFISTADYISSALKLDPGSDVVLDVGCDSAMVSRLVSPRCRGFVGVDFIPGMMMDIQRDGVQSAAGKPASLMAGDGRSLPFRSRVFTKAYCSGVLHTLPSHADGLKMVAELVRVCKPGGRVLVAAVPDAAKHFRGVREVWRRAGLAGKARLVISLIMPLGVKDILRRLPGLARRERLVFLEYDLGELKRRFEARGIECQVLDFPESYWSSDFRKTRSNLLLRIPYTENPPAERN